MRIKGIYSLREAVRGANKFEGMVGGYRLAFSYSWSNYNIALYKETKLGQESLVACKSAEWGNPSGLKKEPSDSKVFSLISEFLDEESIPYEWIG